MPAASACSHFFDHSKTSRRAEVRRRSQLMKPTSSPFHVLKMYPVYLVFPESV